DQPGAWRGEAQNVADSYIRQLGPQLVLSPNVTMLQPEQNTVGVEISARVPTVFPGLDLTVHAQSLGPVERVVKDGGNGWTSPWWGTVPPLCTTSPLCTTTALGTRTPLWTTTAAFPQWRW